jgi:peptidyl-prolyl cis-trans isomerase B (cyclophilin B)
MKRLALVALAAGLAVLLPAQAQEKKNPIVVMDTSMGKVTIELFEDKAPITVKNFLRYVDEKHYDGTLFHRVIADFMIQGGGFDQTFTEKKTHERIKNESFNGLTNTRGTIAMARLPMPDTATAQFYINVKDNPGLDRANARDKVGYAVFGRVTEGMDVVDKIRRVETGERKGHEDVPKADVVIRSVRRADKK